MSDSEMRQLFIDLQPGLAVGVVVYDNFIGKKGQRGIADPREKTHREAIWKEIPPPVNTEHIQKDKECCDQKGDICVRLYIDIEVENRQEGQNRPGELLNTLSPLILFSGHTSQICVGIGAAEKYIENIKGGEGNKAESQIFTNTIAVHHGRQADQSDRVRKDDRKITDQAGPEHDLASLFKGNILECHDHKKDIQKGNAGSRHLLDHHHGTENRRDCRNRPGRQMHIRKQDPDQEYQQADISGQFRKFVTYDGAETAVVNICLHHPEYESCKSHKLIKPDPRCILRDPESDGFTVKNHIFSSPLLFEVSQIPGGPVRGRRK